MVIRSADLRVLGLRTRVRLGCTEGERAFPQVVRLDIRVTSDVEDAVRSDDVADAVDYAQIAERMHALCAERQWRLLETMAVDLGREILPVSPRIREVEVTVTKTIFAEADGVAFTAVLAPG